MCVDIRCEHSGKRQISFIISQFFPATVFIAFTITERLNLNVNLALLNGIYFVNELQTFATADIYTYVYVNIHVAHQLQFSYIVSRKSIISEPSDARTSFLKQNILSEWLYLSFSFFSMVCSSIIVWMWIYMCVTNFKKRLTNISSNNPIYLLLSMRPGWN